MTRFAESDVEEAALSWLEELGYAVLHGLQIAPGEPAAERENYQETVLTRRLRKALPRLNPTIPAEALERVLQDRPLREELIARGREQARRFTWRKLPGSFLRLIKVSDLANI